MRKKKVYIINGLPRAGKDTFIEQCIKVARSEGIKATQHSSIDSIKGIARREFGWDGLKDQKARNLLAELKDAATEYNDAPFKLLCKHIREAEEAPIFICIREPQEIQKLVDWCEAVYIPCTTILITGSPMEEIPRISFSNRADVNVAQFDYDIEIYNEDSLDNHQVNAAIFMRGELFMHDELLEEDQDQNAEEKEVTICK